jgi:pyruvate ferredoxin oxidoreductase alpha subunit
MVKQILEASHAVAEAVKNVNPAVVAAYPITPQTHVVERLSDFVADGILKTEYIRTDSEFSAISACLGAAATGVRAYTATSSQGIALMNEVLFIVSGLRLPVCMTLVNRALSSPINIWNDHQDSVSHRDTGWIQLYAETAQEAHDLTIMQFKISENKEILAPSMVCLDGFTLSHVYEPVDILPKKDVDEFVGSYQPHHAILDPKTPLTIGSIGFPTHYMELRYLQHKDFSNALQGINKVFTEFSEKFVPTIENSRPEQYRHLELYKMEDANIAFVAMGSMCGSIKIIIDKLRKKGEKVGLIKVVTFRPFPFESVKLAVKNVEKLAVLEKAFSTGYGGVLFAEMRSALYDLDTRPTLRNFIVGLGGRDVKLDSLVKIYEMTRDNKGKVEEWIW